MKRLAIAVLSLALPGSMSLSPAAFADQSVKPPAQAVRPKPPSTTEEHVAAARSYREQANQQHHVAEKQFMIQLRRDTPGQLAPSDWYYAHCQKLIDAAAALARTSTELAEYHEKTARELQTKARR